MTVSEMEIAELAKTIVQEVMKMAGDARTKIAALQVAQHIIGQANAIEEANKAANQPTKKPQVGGPFL